jgi:carbamoyltransferase
MPVYVLGTHVSHDGSACLLKDGKIAVAIEKERLTGIKHDGGNDNAAIQYCLRAEGITLRDVELVVQNANFDMFQGGNDWRNGERLVGGASNIVTISHHLAHAYSAIGTAPFEEMAVLTIDGCGNCFADCIDLEGTRIPELPPTRDLEQSYFEKDSYYSCSADGEVTPIFKDFSPPAPSQRLNMYPATTMHSIGGAYFGVSKYVFGGSEDPGKLMGLAPYGKPGVYGFEMFRLENGRVFLNYEWMGEFRNRSTGYAHMKKNFQYYADIAWHVQREIERALIYVVSNRYEMYPCPNLAYSGGVALNAVANSLIRTHTKFRDVYFQPAAGDNGLALGAAYYGWMKVMGKKRKQHNSRSNFGKTYTLKEIRAQLSRNSQYLTFQQASDPAVAASALLAEGKVIGWFQGGSEFGPRALGHRSILASPTRGDLQGFINSKIKFREEFRPFAPSVTSESASTYFEMDFDSPYMILVATTRDTWKRQLPAVVHVDGSARVQTVHQDISPLFYRLHKEVEERTGIPILLNTSFNKRGTPIVETPGDAISLFLNTALDALVIENWVVLKKQAPFELERVNPAVDEIFGSIETSLRAGRDIQGLNGTLRIVVTGIEQSWTVNCSDPAKPSIQRSEATPVDHTIVLNAEALFDLVKKPQQFLRLFMEEKIHVPGLAANQLEAMKQLQQRMQALMSLASG